MNKLLTPSQFTQSVINIVNTNAEKHGVSPVALLNEIGRSLFRGPNTIITPRLPHLKATNRISANCRKTGKETHQQYCKASHCSCECHKTGF